jgi:ABC-type transport system involved in cytochrome c biogenesis permease subunit
MDRVSWFCFVASYATALGLEVWHQLRPRPVLRLVAQGLAAAGLLAQTFYLHNERPPLAWAYGSLLLVAWALVIFYIAGSLHHPRLAWGVFVLPLVLLLVGLGALGAALDAPPPGEKGFRAENVLSFQRAHAVLLLLAAVGLCVGFVASLMYLVQAHRLRAKVPPNQGLRLLSLERLEAMNRRAVALAFPLLTLGVLIGAALMFRERLTGWDDPRVLAALVLWLAFAVLVYLRYAAHLRGRPVAVLTIVTFALLLGCLTLKHPIGQGGGRALRAPDGSGGEP